MPTSTWTAKLSWDSVSVPDPDPGNPDNFYSQFEIGLTAICKPMNDPMPQYNTPVDYGSFHLSVGYNRHFGTFAGIGYRFGDSEINPNRWSSSFTTPSVSGYLLSDFTSGGTLLIRKDYDSDLIYFEVPFWNWTTTLSTLNSGIYYNTQPLVPQGYASNATIADPTVLHPAYDVDYSAKFYSIVAQENGSTYKTISLASTDPGTWWMEEAFAYDPSFGVTRYMSGIGPYWTLTQEATRQKIRFQVAAASYPSFRIFSFIRHLKTPVDLQLDTAICPVSGTLYVAYGKASDPTKVFISYTQDNGVTLTEVEALSDPSWTVSWVNVNVDQRGFVYLHFLIGTGITFEVGRSQDFGRTWEGRTGIVFPLVAVDQLRVKVDPLNGQWYFFYWTVSAHDLVMTRRSLIDTTDTLSPQPLVVVESGIMSPSWPCINFDAKGFVYVTYSKEGLRIMKMSRDHGVTWESYSASPTDSFKYQVQSDGTQWGFGLGASVELGLFNFFVLSLSQDMFILDLFLAFTITAFTAPTQYAGIEWGSKNQLFLVYFSDTTPTVSILRSDDMHNFVTP